MKHFRAALLLLAVAVFSASAWADGVDPKVIPIKGTGSTPITLTNPNPTVNAQAEAPNAANLFCLGKVACVLAISATRRISFAPQLLVQKCGQSKTSTSPMPTSYFFFGENCVINA
jgi:hypothetical protein